MLYYFSIYTQINDLARGPAQYLFLNCPYCIAIYWFKVSYEPYFVTVKNYTLWITDLSVKCKSIKLLEDNTGENLDDLG